MNDSPLANVLLQFNQFNAEQLQLIRSKAVERHYPAGAYFSEAGQVAREIALVVSGIFRVCYFNNEGSEITKYFIDENHFVVDLQSYRYQLPSTEYVQAVTDMQVLVFSTRDWQSLNHTIVSWPQVESNLIARSLLEKVERLSPLVHEDADTRYGAFLANYPGLANRIPLSYLASYIGITPQSLSRLRKHK